jgi:hypothetical protein
MDFEKLHSGVPEAQKRVEDHRAFDLKVATVSKVRERLQEKLSGTISFFSEVVEEFPGEPIIIERIDPSSKEDSASGAIGGITVIELEGLNKDGGPATTGNIGPFAVVGYELTFTFLPFREGFSGEIDSARKVPRGTETTIFLELPSLPQFMQVTPTVKENFVIMLKNICQNVRSRLWTYKLQLTSSEHQWRIKSLTLAYGT